MTGLSLIDGIDVPRETYCNIVLAGGINIIVSKDTCNTYSGLCNVLKEQNMQYLVDFPTRVTTECVSAIDNIITIII